MDPTLRTLRKLDRIIFSAFKFYIWGCIAFFPTCKLWYFLNTFAAYSFGEPTAWTNKKTEMQTQQLSHFGNRTTASCPHLNSVSDDVLRFFLHESCDTFLRTLLHAILGSWHLDSTKIWNADPTISTFRKSDYSILSAFEFCKRSCIAFFPTWKLPYLSNNSSAHSFGEPTSWLNENLKCRPHH